MSTRVAEIKRLVREEGLSIREAKKRVDGLPRINFDLTAEEFFVLDMLRFQTLNGIHPVRESLDVKMHEVRKALFGEGFELRAARELVRGVSVTTKEFNVKNLLKGFPGVSS